MNCIPANEFDLSAVLHLIRSHAVGLFEQWRGTQSDTKIQAPSEKMLVRELTQCFADALTALKEEDLRRQLPGWEHGFVLGFVEGTVSTRWRIRYVLPGDLELAKALWLKHALSVLAADRDALVRIEQQIQADLEALASPSAGQSKPLNSWLADDEALSLSHWKRVRIDLQDQVRQALISAVAQASADRASSCI